MRAAIKWPSFPTTNKDMRKPAILSAIITGCLAYHGDALAAAQVCGTIAGHDVVVPAEYAYSNPKYAEGTGYVTCESEIAVLEIRARLENVDQVSLKYGHANRDEDYLITIQKQSDEPKISVKDTLAAIYDPEKYTYAAPPYPKVLTSNGLIYIRGGQKQQRAHRSDVYIKPDKSGFTEMMVYCEVAPNLRDARNCLMGYTDNEFGVNVVVRVSQSEVGNYHAIMRTAKNTIEPIFTKTEKN